MQKLQKSLNKSLRTSENTKNMTILVAGGTGFVGRHVVDLLAKKGHDVIVYHRNYRAVPTHADMVINCVGIIREDTETFHEAHIDMTTWLVRLAKKLKVKKYIQISAIGVDYQTTAYQRTKAASERIVKKSGLNYAIIRPSLIFGPGDRSINSFRSICRTGFFPVLSKAKVQPVHVDVLSQVVYAAVVGKINNRTVEVAGPEVFTYKELAQRLHPGVTTIKLPRVISKSLTVFSPVFKTLPTKDMLIMLRQDNVTNNNIVDKLGIKNVKLK